MSWFLKNHIPLVRKSSAGVVLEVMHRAHKAFVWSRRSGPMRGKETDECKNMYAVEYCTPLRKCVALVVNKKLIGR